MQELVVQPPAAGVEAQTDLALQYLKGKRTLLSSPGVLINDVYYSAVNTTVSESEVTYNNGRLQISLSQLQFGGQSQIVIPNNSLISTLYLHLQLPTVPANVQLPRGWGLAAINQLSYILGSSNVSQLSISGQTLMQVLMEQSETAEKATEQLDLAGGAIVQPTTAPIDAYIILDLPFSRAQGLFSKLPIDSTLMNNPITIQIAFNQGINFIGGTGAAAYMTSILSSFSRAEILVRQGDFFDKAQSLKFPLLKAPDSMYSYPFVHRQSFTPSRFTGSTNPGAPVNLTLQSFINADLVSIVFGCVQVANLTSTAGSSVNPFLYDPISNVVLSFNGLVMYNSPAQLYRLYNMNSQMGAGYVSNVQITGTTSPFTASQISTYLVRIDFSRLKTFIWEGHYANVWRIANNTLTLQFNTSTGNDYFLFATYAYNGVVEMNGMDTKIYFD